MFRSGRNQNDVSKTLFLVQLYFTWRVLQELRIDNIFSNRENKLDKQTEWVYLVFNELLFIIEIGVKLSWVCKIWKTRN